MSVDIVRELYQARKELSQQGIRTDLVANATKSWSDYLYDCDLERSTVHRWLERYIPAEDRLLSFDEFTELKQIEDRKKMSEEQRMRELIVQRHKTGKTPPDWDDKAEARYQRWLKDNEDAKRRVQAIKEKAEAERLERVRKQEEFEKEQNFFKESMKVATDEIFKKAEETARWKDRIRLSDSGKDDPFMDAILEYLEGLTDDNRRIEACQNIIKICRNISVQLQKVS